jgi:hypothetical protein
MKSKLAIALALTALLLFLSSSIGQVTVLDPDRVFDTDYFYREGEGIYVNTVDRNNVTIMGQNVKIRWGYDKEVVEVPYKQASMIFWFEHNLPQTMPSITPDPCAGNLEFITSYPTDTQLYWDYNLTLPNYSYDVNSIQCVEQIDANNCLVYDEEFDENIARHCDQGIVENTCYWNMPFFNGTYSNIPKSKWRSLNSLGSCELQAGKKYWFRHYAEIPAGSRIVFDVNAVFSLPIVGDFVFSIPEPEWLSTAADDYNTGTGFDFSWTKVTSDANVMPTGDDKVHNDQDQAFYDQNLVGYWKFDDTNADGSGVPDDTNRNNDGLLINGADTNAWGLWDTNAVFLGGVTDYVNVGNSSTLNPTDQITIIAWIYRTGYSSGGDQRIVDRTFNTAYYFGIRSLGSADGLEVYFNGGRRAYSSGATDIYTGRWYHVAVTYDKDAGGTDEVKLYVNGTLDVTGDYSTAIGTNSDPTGIGGSAEPFQGYIDEVKIYDRALTTAEIAADYNSWMTNATYSSPIKDASAAANWDTIKWGEDTDVNNSLTIDYRGCSAADCSTAGAWMTGLSGGGEAGGTALHADNNRYFQYRANFDTNKENWNRIRHIDIAGGTDKGSFARLYDVNVQYALIGEPTTCDCPSTGNWEINDGSDCTVNTVCNAPADVHISSGSINIAAAGTLTMVSGSEIIIADGQNLYVEDGGELVIID